MAKHHTVLYPYPKKAPILEPAGHIATNRRTGRVNVRRVVLRHALIIWYRGRRVILWMRRTNARRLRWVGSCRRAECQSLSLHYCTIALYEQHANSGPMLESSQPPPPSAFAPSRNPLFCMFHPYVCCIAEYTNHVRMSSPYFIVDSCCMLQSPNSHFFLVSVFRPRHFKRRAGMTLSVGGGQRTPLGVDSYGGFHSGCCSLTLAPLPLRSSGEEKLRALLALDLVPP